MPRKIDYIKESWEKRNSNSYQSLKLDPKPSDLTMVKYLID